MKESNKMKHTAKINKIRVWIFFLDWGENSYTLLAQGLGLTAKNNVPWVQLPGSTCLQMSSSHDMVR